MLQVVAPARVGFLVTLARRLSPHLVPAPSVFANFPFVSNIGDVEGCCSGKALVRAW